MTRFLWHGVVFDVQAHWDRPEYGWPGGLEIDFLEVDEVDCPETWRDYAGDVPPEQWEPDQAFADALELEMREGDPDYDPGEYRRCGHD